MGVVGQPFRTEAKPKRLGKRIREGENPVGVKQRNEAVPEYLEAR